MAKKNSKHLERDIQTALRRGKRSHATKKSSAQISRAAPDPVAAEPERGIYTGSRRPPDELVIAVFEGLR